MTTPAPPPPSGTVERWCADVIGATELERKLAPPAPPDPRADASWEDAAPPRRLAAPGRPTELRATRRAARTPSAAALRERSARARLVHTFLHHELQAAELFAWAVLAFPGAPRAFRAGLVALARQELGHLALYREHLARLGARPGDFAVRDWFWERVGGCADEAAFVAFLGLGLEGANLDHSARFAAAFRAAGDAEGAAILERVEREEVAHVAFAAEWFERFTGAPLAFDRWEGALPPPLTPSVFQGRPLNDAARERAGMDAAFRARLAAAPPTTRGRDAT